MTKKADGQDQRRHARVADPDMRLKIGGKTYRSVNWSLGGILVDNYQGELSAGSLLTITEIGPVGARKMTTVDIRARVIRADAGAGYLAVQIFEIDTPAYAVFQELMNKRMLLVRGADRTGNRPGPGRSPAAT